MVVTELKIQKNPATVLRKETEDQQEDQTNQSVQVSMWIRRPLVSLFLSCKQRITWKYFTDFSLCQRTSDDSQ